MKNKIIVLFLCILASLLCVLTLIGGVIAISIDSNIKSNNEMVAWPESKISQFTEYANYKVLSTGSLDEIRREITSPAEAIKFRDSNFVYVQDSAQYGKREYVASLQEFYDNGFRGDCEDFAIAIAGLLEDDKYKPLTLSLEREMTQEDRVKYGIEEAGNTKIGHRIYIYQVDGKWGSIGTSYEDDRAPIFDSINELVESFNNEYGESYILANYKPIKNLDIEYSQKSWIYGRGDLKNEK